MNFLRNFLASILGSLFAFGILFVMFLIFISLVGASEDEASVKKNSVLELQLQRPISDYTGINEVDPFAGIFEQSQGLDEIIHAIEVAKNDERIKGISINNNFIIAGLAQTQAIRKSLEDFKSAGKFIYAYADFYMQRDYYLASVADSVFINPVGVLDFKGLSTEVLYYKDLQEKSGIKMEVIRHGKYKSAVEPYLENSMSEDNRTQLSELLHSLWNSMVTDISRNRSITESDLNIIADTLGGRTPEYAIKSGLIDDILFYDEYEGKLSNALGLTTNKDINYSTLDEYVKYSNKKILKKGDDKIAIVFAQGEIFYDEGGPDIIGQGIINEAIIKAREDKKVKAVVLRVNSPGGSALTSDIIWREVALTKEVKPVVVSMGNVAASGGYYIAAGADRIFAEPTTITGSIGVFGTIPNLTELAGDIGINAEQVGTNANAIDYSLFEPMKESFKNRVQESIEDTYQTFLERVSQGRNLTMAQVDSVAQGRVWSGTEAVEVGLVDELGNLDDAIKAAAEIAGLESYGIRKFPKYKSGFERFMEDLEGASVQFKETLIKKEIGDEAFMILKELQSFKERKGIQARMPFALDIK
ncbi:signal peptide peptidase SppA [Maribacter confluentis]|uniref:Signal peptide peptidase SppA n=1 Tax=Maribacter confluentis TaxID=1656093 RepID=A0ABT8RRI0_9FLAO|nr:signal peptide peptidase SppA [Maribacter confluentis]MDO1513529.1 signal peptide peptidase SppA [Maribacter confluentis]